MSQRPRLIEGHGNTCVRTPLYYRPHRRCWQGKNQISSLFRLTAEAQSKGGVSPHISPRLEGAVEGRG
jgi:hypothetical protein